MESPNRDYATRPRNQSGHDLIDIDPELDGLIILGRERELNPATDARRRRLERQHRVKIRTYDWLASQARERLAAAERARASAVGQQSSLGSLLDTFFSQGWSQPEDLVKKAISKAFGGITEAQTNPSATRNIEYEAVGFPFGYDEDKTVEVPLGVVRKHRDVKLLEPYDWNDWINYVERDIQANFSLLVTENFPAEDLQNTLTTENEGIWYDPQWFDTHVPDVNKPWFSRLDVLVYLSVESSYEEKRDRLVKARMIFLRYLPEPDHSPAEKHIRS